MSAAPGPGQALRGAQGATAAPAAASLRGWPRAVASAAFVLAVPLLLVSTSLRSLVGDRELILAGFRQNRVDQATGLDQQQLERIADAFVAYFQAPPGRLQLEVEVHGQRRPLFNEREVQHLEDVQALVQLFLRLQPVAAGVVAIRAAVALALERSAGPIGRDMLWGSGLVVALVALVGTLSLLDFSALWVRFHQLAFRNQLWQFDPRRDYLIMLFPEPFWFAATLRLATGLAAATALLAAAGFLAWRSGSRRGRGYVRPAR